MTQNPKTTHQKMVKNQVGLHIQDSSYGKFLQIFFQGAILEKCTAGFFQVDQHHPPAFFRLIDRGKPTNMYKSN